MTFSLKLLTITFDYAYFDLKINYIRQQNHRTENFDRMHILLSENSSMYNWITWSIGSNEKLNANELGRWPETRSYGSFLVVFSCKKYYTRIFNSTRSLTILHRENWFDRIWRVFYLPTSWPSTKVVDAYKDRKTDESTWSFLPKITSEFMQMS